jgi:hypothetical protein
MVNESGLDAVVVYFTAGSFLFVLRDFCGVRSFVNFSVVSGVPQSGRLDPPPFSDFVSICIGGAFNEAAVLIVW